MTSIGFIGGGRMAEAIIKGLTAAKSDWEIHVSDSDPARREHLRNRYSATAHVNNAQLAQLVDVIVLAIKPQVFLSVVKDLTVKPDKLVVSIAAGVTLDFLENAFPQVPVVRVMPNNPALVKAGMTAISTGPNVSRDKLLLVEKIFSAVGEIVHVEEKHMDAVTGLSGSGPAYVYLMIEALTAAGRELGLAAAVSEKLALQTVWGAAQTMLKTGQSAAQLREMVTSPGGTTLAGLKVLEEKQFFLVLVEAVKAAAVRAQQLSQ
ncbi:pyrroline-5-carboxylate reductase [Candidatus Saganbacteria bacterium]|nr:pyrroline-5-carboxylate reductase [Candidatus Saganbacteria bacterium]